jgi:hypothetical protein
MRKMSDPVLTPWQHVSLELAKVLVPAAITIGGGLWVVLTYFSDQEKAREKQHEQIINDSITLDLKLRNLSRPPN